MKSSKSTTEAVSTETIEPVQDTQSDLLTYLPTGLTPEDLALLSSPLPRDDGHSVRPQKEFDTFCLWLTYTEEEPVIRRLNQIDPNWGWDILDKHFGADFVTVYARLTVKGVARDCVGTGSAKGEDDVSGDTEKGAATDALKRGARLFGIGLYLKHAPQITTDWVKMPKNATSDEKKAIRKAQGDYAKVAMGKFLRWYDETFGTAKEGSDPDLDEAEGEESDPEEPRATPTGKASTERRMDTGQKQPVKRGEVHEGTKPTTSEYDAIPWKKVVAQWTKERWGMFWSSLKVKTTLTEDEAHEVFGVESMKDAEGTYGEVAAKLLAAGEAKKAGLPLPVVTLPENGRKGISTDAAEGSAVISRVFLKAVPGGKPQIIVYGCKEVGNELKEDPLPVVDERDHTMSQIRGLFMALVPKVVSPDGIWIYDRASDPDQLLTVNWERHDDHTAIADVTFA